MKRMLFLACMLLIIAPTALAQSNPIPNNSFEQWDVQGPLRWATSNNLDNNPPFINVTQSGMAHTGTSSARLEVKAVAGQTVPAAVIFCELHCQRDPDAITEDRSFTYTERHNTLTFYAKRESGTGSLLVDVAILRNGDLIGATAQTVNIESNEFQEYNVGITYVHSAQPDHASVSFTALTGVGTVIYIDSAAFTNRSGGNGSAGNALLVVGDKDNLTTADGLIKSQVEGLGYAVLLGSEDEVRNNSPAGLDLVVVAGSVEEGTVTVDWSNSAVPTVVLEPDVFDNLGITTTVSGTASHTTAPVMELDIVESDHPIANGASGTFDVFTEAHGMSFGARGAGEGTVVARAENAKTVILAYDHGDRLADGATTNIGRKVGFFMGEESAQVANGDGMILLPNTILWATSRENEITTNVAVEEISGEVPGLFALGQNYPNPFNPATVIPFEVQHPAHVSLIVYDVLGREITTLVDRVMATGSYMVDFDALDLPSGVYFYQLRAGGIVQSGAMLLQK
ncbi:MAG TPA: T9SS type A sorting domain-containing protein [Rhodothermales bacterium]|nr:T9SS type A sorting domain-containing protein [Rhodothermales bacterium]